MHDAIAAGTPIETLEPNVTYSIAPKQIQKYPDAFFLKDKDDSMNRIFPDGSYALVNPSNHVDHDGEPYAVSAKRHNTTIKHVQFLNDAFELIPDSIDSTYAPVEYNYNGPDTETILTIVEVVFYGLPFDWSF